MSIPLPVKNTLTLVVITIGFVLFFTYSWTAFATITAQSGLNGSLYLYYQVSQLFFFWYNVLVAIITGCMTTLLLVGLLRKQPPLIKKGYWIFLLLVVILTVGEIYLQTRFTTKG